MKLEYVVNRLSKARRVHLAENKPCAVNRVGNTLPKRMLDVITRIMAPRVVECGQKEGKVRVSNMARMTGKRACIDNDDWPGDCGVKAVGCIHRKYGVTSDPHSRERHKLIGKNVCLSMMAGQRGGYHQKRRST